MSRAKWSEDDEMYLELYANDPETTNYKDAAETLGIPEHKVMDKAAKLRKQGESVGYVKRPFKKWEIEYIKEYYKVLTAREIAEELDRDMQTVINKARQLGIRKQKKLKDYDLAIRRLASKGYYKEQIAKELGLNSRSLRDYVKRNGITCRKATKEERTKKFKQGNNWVFKSK